MIDEQQNLRLVGLEHKWMHAGLTHCFPFNRHPEGAVADDRASYCNPAPQISRTAAVAPTLRALGVHRSEWWRARRCPRKALSRSCVPRRRRINGDGSLRVYCSTCPHALKHSVSIPSKRYDCRHFFVVSFLPYYYKSVDQESSLLVSQSVSF